MQALTLFLLIALPSSGQEVAPPLSVRDDYSHEIELAERIGGLLFTKIALADQARLAAEVVVDRRLAERAHSWVTVVRDGQWLVRFVGSSPDHGRAYYDVRFSADGVPSVVVRDSPTRLDKEETRMFQAKQSALRALPYRCSDDYQAIALRSPDGLGWTVYLVARSNDPQRVVIGGHFRATLTLDGLEVEAIEALSGGCLERPRPTLAEEQSEQQEFWIMNPLTPTPLEIHVLLSLLHDLQIQVGTSSGAWNLRQGEIEHAGVWPSK